MTDDEINRRVAEIEGWSWDADHELWMPPDGFTIALNSPPPYATNWGFCGALIEKYECSLNERGGEGWVVDTRGRCGDFARTPQRAICLAVIAAHEKPAAVA